MSSPWPPRITIDPIVIPETQAVPYNDFAFRDAVLAITTAAADDLKDTEDRDEARKVIQAQVQYWAQGQLAAGVPVSFATQRRLVDAVIDERFELGVLTPYVKDSRVESIDLNGCDQVWITYNDGACARGPAVATSDDDLIKMIQMWALHKSYNPREFSAASPLLNTALRPGDEDDGVGVRLSATMAVTRRPCASIRCHRLVDVTLDDLLKLGTINRSLHAFLRAAVLARLNIVITGGTAAGKTTLLRALASVIDPAERLATLESDYELFLDRLTHRHQNVIAFQARQANSEGAGAIGLNDLIPHSLRKNIKRIIVGEVRADEIVPMFEAMNTGHPGSMCTVHADGTEEIFNRIVMLWTRGVGAQTPPAVIHLNTGETIDLVVHLRLDPATNTRFVSEVLEVLPPADSELPSRNHIYRPTGPNGRAVPDITPQCLPQLKAVGFDPSLLDPFAARWETR
ncbi:CpaF family protein [Nonomuraea sp. NEAU-A123]|uniref:CpaF family protein n=1 Tax=Nonomuraea sp. NEAU-A123 TaxID=2839649 RepID=UPI001BE413EF|nr:ATPase, T2SS/T4P/T4SS family [Nonomuraea sp. NEAU-A123]MBT2235576.1 Flp pilus assembly complex ATPase component TadA [Nonomuraea sp. NEAU-A123]